MQLLIAIILFKTRTDVGIYGKVFDFRKNKKTKEYHKIFKNQLFWRTYDRQGIGFS